MKRKWIGIGIGIAVLAGAAVFVNLSAKPMTVETDKVTLGTVMEYVEETAEVKMDERMGLYVAGAGIATDVKIAVGDLVQKGQLLVQMDAEAAALQIKDLKAQIAALTAQYNEAKKPVKAAEIAKAEAQLKFAQAAYDSAKQTADTQNTLMASGSVSQEAYRLAMVDLAAKEANRDTAKSTVTLLKTGLSANIKNQYAAQLDSLKAKLSLLEKQQRDLGIKAPVSGVVLNLGVSKGNYVQPGKLLLELGNLSNLYLSCDILAEDMPGIQVGTVVQIENKDLSLMGLSGKVRKIYPTAFSKLSELGISQKRVTVEISLDKPVPELRAGYEVTAKLIVKQKESALLVNKKALFEHQGQDAVFAVENGKAILKVVEKGIENEDQIEIISGLSEGNTVILSPDEALSEGQAVQ